MFNQLLYDFQDYPLTYIDKQPQRDVKQTQTAPKEAKKRKEPKPGLQQLEQDDIGVC